MVIHPYFSGMTGITYLSVFSNCMIKCYLISPHILFHTTGHLIFGLLHPVLHRHLLQNLQDMQGNLCGRGACFSQVQVNDMISSVSFYMYNAHRNPSTLGSIHITRGENTTRYYNKIMRHDLAYNNSRRCSLLLLHMPRRR